jgi:hypothetical protein
MVLHHWLTYEVDRRSGLSGHRTVVVAGRRLRAVYNGLFLQRTVS